MSRSKPTIQVCVLAYLAEHGNGTPEDIAKATGRAQWSVYQRCHMLEIEGVLSAARDGGKLRYSLIGHPLAFVPPAGAATQRKRTWPPSVQTAMSITEQAKLNRTALELAWSML